MSEQIKSIVGRNFKEVRMSKGYTREKVAEKVGIAPRYLTAIENEKRNPSLEVVYKLIHALGVSADVIFYSDKEKDTDAAHVLRLFESLNDRDKKLIITMLDAMNNNK